MVMTKMKAACMHPSGASRRKLVKYAWFKCPQQLLIHGQWWSIFITHLRKERKDERYSLHTSAFKLYPCRMSRSVKSTCYTCDSDVTWGLYSLGTIYRTASTSCLVGSPVKNKYKQHTSYDKNNTPHQRAYLLSLPASTPEECSQGPQTWHWSSCKEWGRSSL